MLVFDKVRTVTLTDGEVAEVKYCEFEGHPVVYLKGKPCIAAAGMTVFGRNLPTIIVSDLFLDAPEHLQKFAIYHEIGHIENGDVEPVTEENRIKSKDEYRERMREYTKYRLTNIDERELKADLYAAKIVGLENSLLALGALKESYMDRHREFRDNNDDEKKIAYHKKLTNLALMELYARIDYVAKMIG